MISTGYIKVILAVVSDRQGCASEEFIKLHVCSAFVYCKMVSGVFLKSLNTTFKNQNFSLFLVKKDSLRSPPNCENHLHGSHQMLYCFLCTLKITSVKQHSSLGVGGEQVGESFK